MTLRQIKIDHRLQANIARTLEPRFHGEGTGGVEL
jgi:hypothetical protein